MHITTLGIDVAKLCSSCTKTNKNDGRDAEAICEAAGIAKKERD